MYTHDPGVLGFAGIGIGTTVNMFLTVNAGIGPRRRGRRPGRRRADEWRLAAGSAISGGELCAGAAAGVAQA